MKKILWLLAASIAFSTFAVEFFVPFYAVFVKNIGGSLIFAGSTWALYKFGSAVVMLFSGKLSDRFEARNVMAVGFFLRVVGTAGYFFVSEPIHLLGVQLIHGCAHALILPPYRKLYAKHLDKGKEGSEWSYTLSLDELITAVAVLAGGFVAELFGFFSVFAVMFAAHLVSFGLALAVRHVKALHAGSA